MKYSICFFSLLFSFSVHAQPAPPSLVKAVHAFAIREGVHQDPTFRYALTQLNNDHLFDAIVLLTGSYWCGSGGCTMLVFKGVGNSFVRISESTITDTPIRVLPTRSHGWRTLIVFSKGRGNVLLRFNGTRYPLNPSTQAHADRAQIRNSKTVLE